MPKYTLMGDYPMKHGGRLVQPGGSVKMTEEEAERYVKSGRLQAPETGTPASVKTTEQPGGAAGKPAAAPPPDPKPASGPGKGGKTNKNP